MVNIKRFGIIIPRKTTAPVYIALYELQLYKRMWRNRSGNPNFEVETMDMDRTPKAFRLYEGVTLEGEMARLKKMFVTNSERLGDVFSQVYPRDEDFAEDFYAAVEEHGVGYNGEPLSASDDKYREPRETEAIEGMTRVLADKLADDGIDTILDIATLDLTRLARVADISAGKAKKLRAAAKELAEREHVIVEE